MKNSAATIHVHAAQGGAFKKCCLRTGLYDGMLRDAYFWRIDSVSAFTEGRTKTPPSDVELGGVVFH